MSAAIDTLIHAIEVAGPPASIEVAAERAAAEIQACLGAPTAETTAQFRRLLAALDAQAAPPRNRVIVTCLLDITQFFYMTAQASLATAAVERAVQAAQALEEPALVRRALMIQGVLKSDAGNLAGAIECLSEALDLALALEDAAGECSVWNNLGVAYLYAAQHRDAIACFQRAIVVVERGAGDPRIRRAALGNIAQCCLHLEDYGQGLRAAELATRGDGLPADVNDALNLAIVESNTARLLLAVGSGSAAREHVTRARHYAAVAQSERAELQAATAEGLCEISAGQFDVGLSRLARVLERARAMRGTLRDALIASIKGHEMAGKPDLALVYLRELMMVTQQIQRDTALAHHRQHLQEVQQRFAAGTNPVLQSEERVLHDQERSLRGKLAAQVADEELLRAQLEMLERLAVTAELRDDATGEHAYRVARLAALLAEAAGEDASTCTMLDLSARLHDIGKMGVPDGILLKGGRLNDAEMKIMQGHCAVGAELLAQSDVPHLRLAEEIARFHHEWWDGSGYPFGIGGTAIPRAARIVALADVFDALTHRRPYKDAWTAERALEQIASLAGRQFDPELARLFLALVPRLQAEHPDLDRFLGEAARHSPFLRARERIAQMLRRAAAPPAEAAPAPAPAGNDPGTASPADAPQAQGATPSSLPSPSPSEPRGS